MLHKFLNIYKKQDAFKALGVFPGGPGQLYELVYSIHN